MAQSIAFRADQGLFMVPGPPFDNEKAQEKTQLETSKNCKAMSFSNNGKYLAWSNGKCVTLANFPAGGAQSMTTTLAVDRAQFFSWSPKDSYLATWEVFSVKGGQQPQQGEPNLKIWRVDISGCAQVLGQIQRKSEGWKPWWSEAEDLCAIRGPNNEVLFYKDGRFDCVDKRLSLAKMGSFSVSPTGRHVVAHMPGQKGAPGFVKMFAYPDFNPERDVVASKSFMLADNMDAKWSPDSKAVLLLMQSDVDKTGASYYGKTQLTYMDTGGESVVVDMTKAGPIYHASWSPSTGGDKRTAEFCVVYGFMPAKVTLFNRKCEKVFDFGTGPRNMALFNGQGTLLMIGGFGNLRGKIEIWDVGRQDKKKVASFEAEDTTDIKWSPDGQHILTSTCAPRLRVSNGYKVWHYSSTLLHETLFKDAANGQPAEELWEATWRPQPALTGQKFNIRTTPISGGVATRQPQASKQSYVPPAARGKAQSSAKIVMRDEEAPDGCGGSKSAGDETLSKSAAKNKKRREAAKKKREEEGANNKDQPAGPQASSVGASANNMMTGDPEKDKKIRKLNEKLAQIAKLKQQLKEGKELEVNQKEKIKKESDLLAEIKKLQLC